MSENKIRFRAEGKGSVEPDGTNTLTVTVKGFNTKGECHSFGAGLVDFINQKLIEKYGSMRRDTFIAPPPPKETVN